MNERRTDAPVGACYQCDGVLNLDAVISFNSLLCVPNGHQTVKTGRRKRENARTWGFTLRRRNDWVRGRCNQSPHECRHPTVVLRPFRNRFPADDRGTDCGERVPECLQPATTASWCGHRGRDRDDFPFELARADHPVDAVLQDARQAEPVFGCCDQNGVTFGHRAPPPHDALWRSAFLDVGIKVWELPKAVKQHHLDAWRRGGGSDLEKRQVPRLPLEAAADAKNLPWMATIEHETGDR